MLVTRALVGGGLRNGLNGGRLRHSSNESTGRFRLLAISPLDGRYEGQVGELKGVFSEYGLIAHRAKTEVAWLRRMARSNDFPELPRLSEEGDAFLSGLVSNFSVSDAERVKTIEKTTNHDLKAVEYFLREKMVSSGISGLSHAAEYLHFACTSEDVNNLAYAQMLQAARLGVVAPAMSRLVLSLASMASRDADAVMLARTHGQPATPTTMGKELANFAYRLDRQLGCFNLVPIFGKFNGATGMFSF